MAVRRIVMVVVLVVSGLAGCRHRPTAYPELEQPDAERLRRAGLNVF